MKSNLFFAIELSDEAREAVGEFASVWRKATGDRKTISWYEPGDYHVTLKFLGPRDECEADAFGPAGELAVKSFRKAQPKVAAIGIRPHLPGAFPELKHPRVLWAGVETTPELGSLGAAVEEACVKFGVPAEERAFRPHITIARCKGFEPVHKPEYPQSIFPEFSIDRFVLMRTLPTNERKSGEKLRYNIVHVFPMRDVGT